MMSVKHTNEEYFAALKAAAAKGDIDASWALASAYADGYVARENGSWFSVRKNRACAERLYRIVAKTRMREVILGLAGVQKNLSDALRLERKGWRMGVVESANNIAMTYSMMVRPKMCFSWLMKGYARDPASCAYHLALCFLVGYGTARSPEKASQLLNRVIRNKWECPDGLECAAKFLEMIARGEIPKAPRLGRSIGSVRPKLH